MKIEQQIVSEVAAAMERERRINLHNFPVRLEFDAGVLTMDGDVEHIMSKKRALEVAAAVSGVERIVDRLRLVPSVRMQDGEIRVHVCNSLLTESLLGDCAIWAIVKGEPEVVRETNQDVDGSIDVEVNNGIVVLNGVVAGLTAKRLAGVLAWWVPGSRDVINGIEVVPSPQDDNDDEVVDTVRLVLEKDPFINASQIKVGCSNYSVTLEGLVKKEIQKQMAEADAWYVFRVDGVTNRLLVEE